MSSRDGSDRTGRPRRSEQPNQSAPSQRRGRDGQANWDIDPAEIDRYLSGRPSREQDSQRTQQSGGTADQLDRLQRAVGGRQNPAQRASRPPATTGREQFVEPDADAYDAAVPYDESHDDEEGYVEEEIRATPKRQQQKQSQRRPASTPRRQTRRAPRRQPEPEYADDEYDEELIQEPAPPPRRSRASGRQPDPQPQYVDRADAYDDELYNDDPYLDYDDDGNWNEPAPRRVARPRPQVKLSRPDMPNVTVPRAISEAAIIHDATALILIGVNVLSLIFMAAIINIRFDVLPQTIFTHVSASGTPENMVGRDAIWRIPLMCTMLTLMAIVAAWFFAQIDRFASRFILGAGLLVQFIAWIALIRYLW